MKSKKANSIRLKFWPHLQHYPKRETLVWVVFSENSVPKQFLSAVLLLKAPIENKQNTSKQVKFLSIPMWGLYINPVLGIGVNIWAWFILRHWRISLWLCLKLSGSLLNYTNTEMMFMKSDIPEWIDNGHVLMLLDNNRLIKKSISIILLLLFLSK